MSIGTGLAFGTLPAWQISRPDLMEVLRESGRSATVSKARQRLRSAFVVVQVALALVLLVGAGLAVNSLLRLSTVQVGFDPRGLLTFQVTSAQPYLPVAGRPGGPTTTNTPTGGLLVGVNPRIHVDTDQMRDRLAALPGVQAATLAVTPPLGGEPLRFNFSEAGRLVPQSEQEIWSAEWYPIGPEYFRTLKVPLIRGREFRSADSNDSPLVALVNATMAGQFWPNEDPIGKRIQMTVLFDEPREIVGVVGDVRQNRYQRTPQPQMYVPRAQLPARMDMAFNLQTMVTTFVVRTSGDPSTLVPSLRAAVADVSPTMAISKVRMVDDYASAQLQDLRQYGGLLGIFGGISVALAVIGLFGITAHAVSQRTNEIGIRRALGANRSAIMGLVFNEGLRLIAIGVTLGIGTSMVLTRSIGAVLWGISATDPLTFAAVTSGLSVVALLACYLPARRALKIDPLTALRAE
jgi:putative ABC transport system permease protein